jgi:hypothetical protein
MDIYRFTLVKILVDWKIKLKRLIQQLKISEIIYDKRSIKLFYKMIDDERLIYEKEIVLIQKIVKDGFVIADIGANRGEYTYFFSRLAGQMDGFILLSRVVVPVVSSKKLS